MSNPMKNLPFKAMSSLLASLCILSAVPAISNAEDFDEYENVKIDLDKPVKGDTSGRRKFITFTAPETGAYLIDIEDNDEDFAHYPFIYTAQQDHLLGMFDANEEDQYFVFQKGEKYYIDTYGYDTVYSYEMKITKSTHGATAVEHYFIDADGEAIINVDVISDKKYTTEWKDENNNPIDVSGTTYKVAPSVACHFSCTVDDGYTQRTFFMYIDIHADWNISITLDGEEFYSYPIYVDKDTPFTLEAIRSGDYKGKLDYQWFADGQPIEGATSAILKIDGIKKATTYSLWLCDEYHKSDDWSTGFFIDIGIENDFHVEPVGDLAVYMDGNDFIELSVKATAKEADGITYKWYVWDYSRGEISVELSETSSSLKVSNVTEPTTYQVDTIDKYGNVIRTDFVVYPGLNPFPDNNGPYQFVDRCYSNILKREADDEGRNYWVSSLKKFSLTGADVARFFIGSDEFIKSGISDDDFIKILYSTFFDREADSDGRSYWLSQLSSGTLDRATVVESFIYSKEWANLCAKYDIISGTDIISDYEIEPSEAVNAFVERMYTTALGRASEPEGKAYWAKELANHRTAGDIVGLAFFCSEELKAQNLSKEEFVTRLYKTFMDREPDADGLAFWTNLPDYSDTELIDSFTKSEEFCRKCVEAGILSGAN